jgi:alpha-glucosidase (family GH31 glycosyl hydrolase)
MKTKIICISTIVLILGNLSFAQNLCRFNFESVADTNVIIPPAWAFGVLYGGYTNQDETIDRIKNIQKHEYPIDVYWIDSWFWDYLGKGKGPKKYIDFIADTISFPNRKLMWDFMQQNNIKGGFWTWNCILKTGNEEAFNEFESNKYFTNVYNEVNEWHNSGESMGMLQTNESNPGTLCGNIDFISPESIKFFKKKMQHFFDEGADFIKLDRTADINVCKTMFEMSQEFGKESKGRGFMLSHSFDTDDESYKKYPAKWTDDTRSDWSIEKTEIKFPFWTPNVAFKENIAMFTDTSKKSSKIPFLTNDTGGYEKGSVERPDEELFIRWLQFSIFNPIVELFCAPENPTSNLPWLYSDRADSIFRIYSHLRMQLFPYIYTYAHLCRLNGENLIRPIASCKYQFMFGDNILVAPIYEKNALEINTNLPKGKWIDYWTNNEILGGNKYLKKTKIDQIPLFVKSGSIIPKRKYASSIEKGTNNELILDIYLGENGRFILIEDDGISNDYLNGKFCATNLELIHSKRKDLFLIFPIEGDYGGKIVKRTWHHEFICQKIPKSVKINNKKANFKFDKLSKKLKLSTSDYYTSKLIRIEIRY